jgi:tetratricopeptide (TPR) repeat protein
MIASLSLAAALALGAAADPCGPVEPAPSPDPAIAAVYRAVGDAEREAGSTQTAAAAYRNALSHDPGDALARAGFLAVCARGSEQAFRDGLRLMQAGDRRGAIAAFERARGGPDASSAALLEGICLYEVGDDDAAAPLLHAAEAEGMHRESARFFLGLVALRAGRSGDAQDLLARSAADPSLAPFARVLVRSARRSGRLVLSFVTESGWDSNVDLTPDTSGPTARTGDAVGALTGVAELRPLGESGPFLRGIANWHEQATYNALDMRSLGGAAGWQGGQGGDFWLAEYGYDWRELARAPYMSAHRLFGTARLQLGHTASAGVSWLTRFETFEPAEDAGYSGRRHAAAADILWIPWARTAVSAGWQGGRDVARDRWLSWWEQGPHLLFRFQAAPAVRVGVDSTLAWRRYDEVDPALIPRGEAILRSDAILDVTALVEVDLADRWTLRMSMFVRRETSTIPDFTFTKVVPMLGLAYTVGLL